MSTAEQRPTTQRTSTKFFVGKSAPDSLKLYREIERQIEEPTPVVNDSGNVALTGFRKDESIPESHIEIDLDTVPPTVHFTAALVDISAGYCVNTSEFRSYDESGPTHQRHVDGDYVGPKSVLEIS